MTWADGEDATGLHDVSNVGGHRDSDDGAAKTYWLGLPTVRQGAGRQRATAARPAGLCRPLMRLPIALQQQLHVVVAMFVAVVALGTAQDAPQPALVSLREIQGSGDVSPYDGQTVRL